MKNEEKFAFAFLLGTLLFVVFCFVMSAFTGCASASVRHDPGRIRESSAYIIGQLESSIEEFDTGLRREIERSRGIESELELYDYETKLVESETKRKILWKAVWALIGVNAALAVTLVALIVLEKKKITDLL